MALPVSSLWTRFDFNDTGVPENIDQILTYVEVTPNRAGIFVYVDGDGDFHVMSDDAPGGPTSGESNIEVDVAVPQNSTLEFDIKPIVLPPDLNSLDESRLFVAVYDQQDNAAGLLFSQSGLAWISSLSGIISVTGIPGSAGIVNAGTWYTVRVVVRGDVDAMYIYITPRDSLATTGHILRYTTAALETPAGQTDAVRVEAYGTAVNPTEAKFQALRLSASLNVPNQPPIAIPGDNRRVLSGSHAKLDGRASSDPEGEDLTYKWRLTSAPSDSQYSSDGTQGWTPAEADPDAVTDVFNDVIGFQDLSLLQAGDLLAVGGILSEISSASFNPDGSLVDPQGLKLTTASLPENQSNLGWSIFHQQAIGSQTAALSYINVDVDGLFVLDLVVNDGDLNSQAAELLIQAVDTALAKASMPDVSWIWKCVGDEWSWVEDRDKVETIWEAFSLVAAGYLYWFWQVQACSALGTIPRTLARKWAAVGTRVLKDTWGDVTWNHLYPQILGGDLTSGAVVAGKTLDIVMAGISYTVTFVGASSLSSTDIIYQINQALPIQLASIYNGRLALRTDSYFLVSSTGTANAALGLSTTADTVSAFQGSLATPKVPVDVITAVNEVATDHTGHYDDGVDNNHAVDDSTNGLTLSWPLSADATPGEVVAVWNHVVSKYDDHDANVGSGGPPHYHTVGGLHPSGLTAAVTIDDVVSQHSQFKAAFNAHLADVVEHTGGDEPDDVNVVTETPEGDSAVDELRTIVISDVVDLTQSNVGLRGFLFWARDVAGGDGAVYLVDRVVSAGKILLRDPLPGLATYEWSVLPTVGLADLDAEELKINEYDQLELSFTPDDIDEQSTVVTAQCSGGRGALVGFNPTPWASYTGLVEAEAIIKCQLVPVYQEVTSIPWLQRVVEDATPLKENKDFIVETIDGNKWIRFFDPSTDPPENWWAEYMLFGNNPTIEANFGYLVGFLEEDAGDLDYLSAVKALFYSYWRGAVVDAIRLGLQVIFGLPMAEVDGTIVDIDTFYSVDLGRILIEDADGTGTVRTYYYNRQADIADNPVTGVPYVVGDVVERFALLCTGVEVLDYMSSEYWFDADVRQGIFHEIEKFHTFYATADVDVFGLENMEIAYSFLDRAKEARTKYVLTPYKQVSDELDITDHVEQEITLYLYDNLRSLGDGGTRMFDDATGGGIWRQQFDDTDPESVWGFDTILHDGFNSGPLETPPGELFSSHDPPHIVTGDLSSLDFTHLNGKTLKLTVGDGNHTPSLIATGRFNNPASLNFDYLRSGSMTPAAAGGAGISTASPWAGRACLEFPGGATQPEVLYTGDSFEPLIYKGTIALRVRTGYTGAAPVNTRNFWGSMGSVGLENLLWLKHTPADALEFDIHDSAGVNIITLSKAGWSPVAGTWYEILVAFDTYNGFQVMLIDGAIAATGVATGVRDNYTTGVMFGDSTSVAGDFTVDNVRVYDDVLHTGVYKPPTVEVYNDPGEVEVTFSGLGGGSTAQDVANQINAIVRNTDLAYMYIAPNPDIGPARVWDSSSGETKIILKSWSRYIEIGGGTALALLGLEVVGEADLGVYQPAIIVHAAFDGTRELFCKRFNRIGASYENHRQDEPGDYIPPGPPNPPSSPTYHAIEDTANALATDATGTKYPLDPAVATDLNIMDAVNDFRNKYTDHDADVGGAYHGGGGGHAGAAVATDLNTAAHLLTSLEVTYHEHVHDTVGYHALEDFDNVFEVFGMNCYDLDFVRDGGSPVAAIAGTPVIDSQDPKFGAGALVLAGGANTLTYAGAGIVDDIWHAATVRVWFKLDYAGPPPGTHEIFRLQQAAGALPVQVANAITVERQVATGDLVALFNDDTGAPIATLTSGWAAVKDQWYLLEVTIDAIAGFQRLRIDGVTLASGTGIGTRVGGQQYLRLGDATQSRADLDDFVVYSEVLDWTDYGVALGDPVDPVRPVLGLRKNELQLRQYIEGTRTDDFDDDVPAADVVIIGHYDIIGVDEFDLDFSRAPAGNLNGTPVGAPAIIDGWLDLSDPITPGPAIESVQYSGANLVDTVIDAGCFEFWLSVGYLGIPVASQYFLSIGQVPGVPIDGIECFHDAVAFPGDLTVIIYDNLGAPLDVISAPWPQAPGQVYHIEYDFVAGAGVSILYVDGVVHAATAGFAAGNRGPSADLMVVGDSILGAGAPNWFRINELIIYDAMQNPGPFTPPALPMRHGAFTRYDSIYTNGPVDTLQFDQELTGTQTVTRILT